MVNRIASIRYWSKNPEVTCAPDNVKLNVGFTETVEEAVIVVVAMARTQAVSVTLGNRQLAV
jgi:hypothetical protein